MRWLKQVRVLTTKPDDLSWVFHVVEGQNQLLWESCPLMASMCVPWCVYASSAVKLCVGPLL